MNDIFTLAKETILNGGYNLGEKLRELTVIMIAGQISVDEYQALTQLAYEHAGSETSETNVPNALRFLNTEIVEIKKRLAALEQAEEETPVEDAYPEWERWDGQPDSGYKFGDRVTHLGVKYISNYVGLNVWEPGLQGTEALWAKVE